MVKRYRSGLSVFLFFFSYLSIGQNRTIRGNEVPVRPDYFGMHIHLYDSNESWPSVDFAEWRLWDTSTTWHDLEPQPGIWRFDRLDALVEIAHTHHKKILLTLGQTPSWASSEPNRTSPYGLGASAPPRRIKDWIDYVSQVAYRYRGQIEAYEIWNEPNLPLFYTGDVYTLVTLTKEASIAIHRIDSQARVISPSPTTTLGINWLRSYLMAGGGSYVDVIGYHMYVTPSAPEAMLPLIMEVKKVLADAGHSNIGIWNTETGWGGEKELLPLSIQRAFLSRALLLGRLLGLERFYWYSWDNHSWVNLELTTANNRSPTSAAQAFAITQTQMLGRAVTRCTVVGQMWDCVLTSNRNEEHVIWSTAEGVIWYPQRTTGGTWRVTDLEGKEVLSKGPFPVGIEPKFYTAQR